MASHADNAVLIWDLRNFDRPVMTITKHAWTGVSKIAWSPTRRGNLAILAKDAAVVRLFDVQHAPFEADFIQGADVTDAIVEQVVLKKGEGFFSSFNWHPSYSNRMLAVSGSGDIQDIDIPEKIALSWQSGTSLAWSCGSTVANARIRTVGETTHTDDNTLLKEDISSVMRQRAVDGYGLKASVNAQIARGDAALVALWKWLVRCQRLSASGVLSTGRMSPKNVSILHLLADGAGEQLPVSKTVAPDITVKQHLSVVRRQIQRLCGWDFEESNLEDFLKRLELNKQYERAAAIALFHLQLKRAVECLTNGAHSKDDKASNLHLLAIALSGFTTSTSTSMWHDVVGSLKSMITNPYILAAFAFLSGVSTASKVSSTFLFTNSSVSSNTSVNNSPFAPVLYETDISLSDKVAFACSFLTDSQLLEFLQKLASQMEQDGRLDGLLLTGLDESGMRLLQAYLDKTGDIQTVCLVVAVCGGFDDSPPADSQAKQWLDNYRDLLDIWSLWQFRAKLDVELTQSGASSSNPAQKIAACCTYCNRSIASESGRVSSGLPNRQTAPARRAQPRVTACPNCRKPLPRCSLCLMNMGTASQFRSSSDGSCLRPSTDKKSMFKDWMAWCQNCHHGGHAEHMREWYREHTECPVTNCRCRCAQLDENLLGGKAPTVTNAGNLSTSSGGGGGSVTGTSTSTS
ncbi:GATOR2 complex protein MIOS-like [Sycon ciliatum]|uniref:GATOR2 complex protein MIOS-like n=1 Tax=Sycon ciliatum TaxID=27933 RepID=UPI0031F6F9CB